MGDFEELLKVAVASDYPAATAAQRLYEMLSDDDEPGWDGLNNWVWEQAEWLLAREINRRRGTTRKPPGRGPSMPARSRFSEALERYQGADDPSMLSDFALTMRVNDDGEERPLGEMKSADHLFVASRFQDIGQSSLMLAAVHRQVARLLSARPKATTQEVMTQDQYRALFDKLARPTERAEIE